MRILCTGDLHLGRRPSRLPADLDAGAFSCAAIWQRIVEHAIAQRVDLVALSGDVVDKENCFFEALGPLERGLRQLHEAGIPTVAVAGNHDYNVLPQLARSLPDGALRVLGVGGTWERARFEGADGAVHVDGWSFPSAHFRTDPLAAYALPGDATTPALGLLHGDLDVPNSPYAPVGLAALRAKPVAMWLLGHVHAPCLREGAGLPGVLYPGSPQPMDPGETSEHCVWIADLAPGATTIRAVPLSTVRYESLDIDVEGIITVAELRDRILVGVQKYAATVINSHAGLQCLTLRLRLTGSTPLHRTLSPAQLDAESLGLSIGDSRVCVDQTAIATSPAHDLGRLASGNNTVARLAQLILDLDRDDLSAHQELLTRCTSLAGTVMSARSYAAVEQLPGEFDQRVVRAALRSQAGLLLDQLLSQQAAA